MPIGSLSLSLRDDSKKGKHFKVDFIPSSLPLLLSPGDLIETVFPCFIQDPITGKVVAKFHKQNIIWKCEEEVLEGGKSITLARSCDQELFITLPDLQAPVILLVGSANLAYTLPRRLSVYSFWKLDK